MTKFQEEYAVGTKIEGTFSKLPFGGTVVKHIAECVVVATINPRRNLPLYRSGIYENCICLHPNDVNVTIQTCECGAPIANSPDGWRCQKCYDTPSTPVVTECFVIRG